MKKEIQNFEELESFLKKHNYTYPKNWKTKFKKIKRKDRNSSTWKDCRTCLYAAERINHCLSPILKDMAFIGKKITKKIEKIEPLKLKKLMSKHSITAEIIKKKIWPEILSPVQENYFNKIIKKGGKSYYQRNITPEVLRFQKMIGIKVPELIKLPPKKETIIRTMMGDEENSYWNYRHVIMGKPKEDKNNKNIVRKESQEYFKSVCTYIKQPKYNKNFFISHQKPITDMWNSCWNFYLKVR